MEYSNPNIEDYIEEAEKKYGINLEKGKFYGRKFKNIQHFEDFCKFVNRGSLREFLWTTGTFVACLGGFGSLVGLIPYHQDLKGSLELFIACYGAFIGAIALSDRLLPLYEKISENIFNEGYKKYCEENDIL